MRVVFMGTPDFALPTLKALAREQEVVGVYTRPDEPAGRGRQTLPSPVKGLALRLGLPLFQPRSLRGEAEAMARLGSELIVVAAYGLLLPPEVLRLPRYGCLNLHPSLLPRHRGPSPVAFALLAGDAQTGVTLMLMDEGMDTGPILARWVVPIAPEDTTASLTAKLAPVAAELLRENLPRWVGGELPPHPQEEGQATYTRLLKKEDGELDFRLPAQELERRVRAFDPWPGAFTWFKGRRLKVISARAGEGGGGEAGLVVALGGGAGVATGRGALLLLVVQQEGKRPLPMAEFLRGQRDFLGSRLG